MLRFCQQAWETCLQKSKKLKHIICNRDTLRHATIGNLDQSENGLCMLEYFISQSAS